MCGFIDGGCVNTPRESSMRTCATWRTCGKSPLLDTASIAPPRVRRVPSFGQQPQPTVTGEPRIHRALAGDIRAALPLLPHSAVWSPQDPRRPQGEETVFLGLVARRGPWRPVREHGRRPSVEVLPLHRGHRRPPHGTALHPGYRQARGGFRCPARRRHQSSPSSARAGTAGQRLPAAISGSGRTFRVSTRYTSARETSVMPAPTRASCRFSIFCRSKCGLP